MKIPKSGVKLKKIGDYTFFFRVSGNLLYVYEVESTILILAVQKSKGEDFAIDFIARNMDRVERFKSEEVEA